MCKYYSNVNIELEKVKLQSMFGRDSAIYITNDSAFAKYFISTQHKQSKTFIYEVSTTDKPSEHPLAVVHQINQHINNRNYLNVNALTLDYWQPNRQWNFYEYLVSNITITGIIEVVILQECSSSDIFAHKLKWWIPGNASLQPKGSQYHILVSVCSITMRKFRTIRRTST